MKTIKDLFLDELADMYDAERRVVKALPKMAKAATCPDLQTAILSHLKEAEGHVKKLEQIFQSLDEKAKGQTCKDTVGLLEEGDEIEAAFKARRPSASGGANLIQNWRLRMEPLHRRRVFFEFSQRYRGCRYLGGIGGER